MHKWIHAELIKWKGGMFNPKPTQLPPVYYKSMTPEQIFKELKEFYEKAANGAFKEYVPDFIRAAEETLADMGKTLP